MERCTESKFVFVGVIEYLRSMSDVPNNPHDTYFRRVSTRSPDAVCAIRDAVPEILAELVDWSVMELLSCSFISRELRSRYTDILYRTRMAGREAYIYVLLEHQSSVDRMMARRMLGYLVDIWRYYLRQNPNARTLPPVIPVVVHNNSTGCVWSAETEVYDLIDVEEPARSALDPWLPRLQFLLDDVATMDMQALRARKLTFAAWMMVLQQIARGNPHLDAHMKPLLDDLWVMLQQPGGMEDVITVLTYIINLGATTADSQERTEALIRLLTSEFGSMPGRIVDAVNNADRTQLQTWFGLVLTAGGLDQIFGV
ncbi:putative transposase/invertase (TIGR01784 family) [Nocardia tenerifensis]|uniref:Putative transposase/invertase (TIGR01784 family) n=1 Tax=Nocardia tenerifensis TaxID=228006 RepID=A0A318JV93_9NOCA|nr:Rpn family recombination-promoting nuclease/putative transposase [Nocardia tenerifensis]PXX57679.1 putative transposase/invertase (TIGR01784 family) [Nocardia tenerifensis]